MKGTPNTRYKSLPLPCPWTQHSLEKRAARGLGECTFCTPVVIPRALYSGAGSGPRASSIQYVYQHSGQWVRVHPQSLGRGDTGGWEQ